MVKVYEYETGFYEYTDDEGNKRIGKKEQKYELDKEFYGSEVYSKKKVGVVDFYEDDEDEYVGAEPDKRRECPHCLEYGVHVKLAGRILKKGEEKPEDYDQWMQCVNGCGNIFPVHEIEKEKLLKVETEQHVTDNPFEAKKSIVLGIPKRSSPAGKKASARKRREKNRAHHPDKEIDREIQQHGEDNVHIIQDSDP